MSEGKFRQAALVGTGLIGGSMGLGIRSKGLAERVIGADSNPDQRLAALERGAVDEVAADAVSVVRDSDLIVLAIPVSRIVETLERIAPYVSPHALVTDVGSVKAQIVRQGAGRLGDRFVGGHPMAGSEESGANAARADLFEGAAWILCPNEQGERTENALRLERLVREVGARPVWMSAEAHDRSVAYISHLPHALSFAFANAVRQAIGLPQANCLAGGSFRDMTRIAASDANLWRDIFCANAEPLREALSLYRENLDRLESLLGSENHQALEELLREMRLG